MANLERLQEFAAENNFDLTAPLTHADAERLADYWLPETFFYWDERFHPITLDDKFTMVDRHFARLLPQAQDAFRVVQLERDGVNAVPRAHDPPIVRVPDGFVTLANHAIPVFRALGSGSSAREALRLPEVGGETSITHGASFTRSNAFFGSITTLHPGNTAAAGEPFMPRALERPDEQNSPSRINVNASFFNLISLLKYELLAGGDSDYPPDALRGGFDITSQLLVPIGNQPPLPADLVRAYLLAAIQAFEEGRNVPDPPLGWRLDRIAWDAVTRFAFLQYDFFYAYNDFERYQTALFDNEHEGDNEGCCLVFDRGAIFNAAASSEEEALLRVFPHSIITSVHEEHHKSDRIRVVSPPPPQRDPLLLARDHVQFKVFIAGGSHATYLSSGTHDLVDFQDTWATVEEEAPILLVLSPAVLAVAIILAIIEHFVDTEDFTSDEGDGIHSGPDDLIAEDPLAVRTHLLTMPMSADNHIYQPANGDLLLLRSFAGKWGGHDGLIDKSPVYTEKSGRYFRRLLRQLRG